MPRSNPTSIDEVTTVVIISGINFWNFNSQKSNMVADIKPYLHTEIANGFLIYEGQNSQN